MLKKLTAPFARPVTRRLDHLEAVINARSEETVRAIGELRSDVQRIADANEALALNVSEIIESHLRIHAESMIALGEALAALDARDADTRDAQADQQ